LTLISRKSLTNWQLNNLDQLTFIIIIFKHVIQVTKLKKANKYFALNNTTG